MFKIFKKQKQQQVIYRDYIVVGDKFEIKEIQDILIKSLVNNNRKIIRTHNSYKVYKNGRVARVRFINDTETLHLDGLRVNLALTGDSCSNKIIRTIMYCTLSCDGESLYLCDSTIKQLVGDILVFTEGVDVDVKKGL